MEENKNKEALSETSENSEEKNTLPGLPDRSCVLRILAGLYLVYTGYRLCKNVLDGVDGGGPGFFAAGAAFVLIGIGLAVWGGYNALKNDNVRKAAKAAEEHVQAIKNFEPPKEEKSSMSISERANLTAHLEEEESEE